MEAEVMRTAKGSNPFFPTVLMDPNDDIPFLQRDGSRGYEDSKWLKLLFFHHFLWTLKMISHFCRETEAEVMRTAKGSNPFFPPVFMVPNDKIVLKARRISFPSLDNL
ncbi:hypothetical protein CDAR_369561 [Caerostris darwini]|uniref:Uncharacterized protein n=1 Tax=Caerostris darwini TaxID=1538125 RepID=A0AAV4RWQ8_9ARAC|nr:hypothetical protein CDAR_369561 [Caerostris darwini]